VRKYYAPVKAARWLITCCAQIGYSGASIAGLLKYPARCPHRGAPAGHAELIGHAGSGITGTVP